MKRYYDRYNRYHYLIPDLKHYLSVDLLYHIQYGDHGPSESEFFEIEISTSGRAVISKSEICDIFHIKRFDLDEAVRKGIIPEGRKRVGHRELYWFLHTISNWVIKKLKSE